MVVELPSVSAHPPRLRVLQVVGSLNTGGAETMILSAAEAIADHCSMDFLVFGENIGSLEGWVTRIGSRVVRMPSLRTLGPRRYVNHLSKFLRLEGYDAIHSHLNVGSGLVMKAAHIAEVPMRIVHSHTSSVTRSPIWRGLYASISRRWILRHSTHLVACSDQAGKALFGEQWLTRSKGVIRNGIDVQKFIGARNYRENVRAELGLEPDQQVVGMISSLTDVKNHEFMLELIARDDNRSGQRVLLLVGEGERRVTLEERANKLGIAQSVRFLGLRGDVPRLLGAIDYVAMPSFHEGIPVSLIEAQAAGVPSVVSSQIDHDCDLGLDLITWLPLDRPDLWLEQLDREVHRPDENTVKRKVFESGYDVRSSSQQLLELYRSSAK